MKDNSINCITIFSQQLSHLYCMCFFCFCLLFFIYYNVGFFFLFIIYCWVTSRSLQKSYEGVATFVAAWLLYTSGTLFCLAVAEVIKGQLSGDAILSSPNRCRAELTAATLTPHVGWTRPRQMELCLSPILSSTLSVWIDAAFSKPGGAGGNVNSHCRQVK